MPKLNTTIDNLELKSNKIISTSTASPDTWTDSQYPSAKTLLNIAHPIGSIITTSTNTDPAATLGGTWVLIDKAFRNQSIVLDSSCWTKSNADLIITSAASTVALVDHVINIRLKLQPTVQLTDSDTLLGTLNLQKIGVNSLLHSVLYATAQSDEGQCTINYSIAHDTGAITVHDVLNVNGTHTMASGQFFFINLTVPVSDTLILGEFCDKFYWKRTA